MLTQVAPENHIIYYGLVLSRHAGPCPMERDSFSLLILMIEHGDGWVDTISTEVLLQMQLMDTRSSRHRYSSLRV